MKKELKKLGNGTHFTYGGVEWVKLNDAQGAAVVLAAGCLFNQAFDEENCNNWAESSLREKLNGEFLKGMCEAGVDNAAFVPFAVDLTSDDGMTDYGTTTDKIALISCDQYRKYRKLIQNAENGWWTVTPWSCLEDYSYVVRVVDLSGTLDDDIAYHGFWGVRPLCNLKSDILVSVDGEESRPETAARLMMEAIIDLTFDEAGKATEIFTQQMGKARFNLEK